MGRAKPRVRDHDDVDHFEKTPTVDGEDELDELTYLRGGSTDGTPKDTANFVYLSFILLGAATLLPYNAFISAPSYFGQFYKFLYDDDLSPTVASYYRNMDSWFLLWYSVTSILCTVILQFTVSLLPVGARIVGSVLLSIGILVVPPLISYIRPAWGPMTGVVILWSCSALVGITCAFFQSAVYGLAALLGGDYPQAVMTGIGLVGASISAIRLVTLFVLPDHPCTATSNLTDCDNLNYCEWIEIATEDWAQGGECIEIGYLKLANTRLSAAIYFGIGIGGLLVTLLVYFLLPRARFYRHCMRKYESNKAAAQGKSGGKSKGLNDSDEYDFSSSATGKVSALKVIWKIRSMAFVIFWTMGITLLMFPGFFVWITNKLPDTGRKPNIGKEVYTVILILVFNSCDTLGRFLPKYIKFVSPRMLPWLSLFRTVFAVLFWLCVGHGASQPVVSKYTQWVTLGLDILFAITNGYCCSLGFMYAPQTEDLEAGELEVVGVIVALALFIGVALGSAGSLLYLKVLDLQIPTVHPEWPGGWLHPPPPPSPPF